MQNFRKSTLFPRSIKHDSWQKNHDKPHLISLFLLIGILGFFFSSPQGAGPDESWHQATAWHLIKTGQIEIENRTTVNGIPASIAKNPCFAFNSQITSDCVSKRRNDVGQNHEFKVFNYPPVSYLFVGAGQRISQLISMGYEDLGGRIGSIVINFLLLSMTLRILNSRLIKKQIVLLTVMNPMLLFLIAVGNPSSLEITGCMFFSVALWRFLVIEDIQKNYKNIIGLVIISLMITFTRPSGIYWVTLISVICVFLFSRFNYKSSKLLGMILVPSLIGVYLWNKTWNTEYEILPGHLPIKNPSYSNYYEWLKNSILSSGEIVQTSIGKLGWLDTPVPSLILISYCIYYITFMILMLQYSTIRRHIEVILVIVFLIPIFGNFLFWNSWPNYWQGRYSLPIIISTLLLIFIRTWEERKTILLNNLVSINMAIISIMIIVNLFRYKTGIPTSWLNFDLQKLVQLNLSEFLSLLAASVLLLFSLKYWKIGFRLKEIKL